jgi:hypothetical protein
MSTHCFGDKRLISRDESPLLFDRDIFVRIVVVGVA